MGRTFEISGNPLILVLYVSQLVAVLLALGFVVFPLDSSANVVLGLLFGAITLAVVFGMWRRATGSDGGSHLGTAEDITYDPFADPGQAAKDRWEKVVRRLPGSDDVRD
ncbi:hypothetical protein C453_10760 [Haloferax elongans ATCC BAA-1513]|uniref:Uncharacterized protein n=1 Tax=Haloferax elongans ATCC BAA-1513 TaxID=1230453 RepID=M0HKR9_HALEO|nr:hypothetical protein [Haloferax elongans]ELZ85056.1 hypothetical protein C453_10760 [Haloferax elongans ATCC BAA-1513]